MARLLLLLIIWTSYNREFKKTLECNYLILEPERAFQIEEIVEMEGRGLEEKVETVMI